MSENVKSITCPNCGSVDVSIEKNDVAKCHSCGGQFIINVDDNMLKLMKQVRKFNTDPEKIFIDGYKYDPSITKGEFVNQVLLMIKDNCLAPSYVFDEMKLGDVEVINVPIYSAEGHADINYSRTIGYDRLEQWTEYKITKYSDGTSKTEPKYKSRTVTDWHPDSGMLCGDSQTTYYEDKYNPLNPAIKRSLRDENNISPLTDDELDSYEVNPDIVNSMKNDIINDVFRNNISYPGNHVKDEYYSGNAKITKLSLILYPVYTLEIIVRDKTIYYYASPNGEIDIQMTGDYPSENDVEEYFAKCREYGEERRALTKKPKLIRNLIFLATLAAFITCLVFGSKYDLLFLTIIGIVLFVGGLIPTIMFHSKVKKLNKIVSDKVIQFNKERNARLENEKNEGYNRFINRQK